MTENKRQIGAKMESMAFEFLQEKGIRIINRNFTCRLGEIDLIGLHKGTLVFFEVKYRSSVKSGLPEEAVNAKKQNNICRVADYYRMKYHVAENISCRFDVVAILGDKISWYKNAFEYC